MVKMQASANPKARTNLYFDEQVLADFKRICLREGHSMSVKLEAFMRHYNSSHRTGNPQLTMEAYAKPEGLQPMRVLCLFIDGAMSDGGVHCRRAGRWLPGVSCYSCEKNFLRKKE
jgi:hypothetical protein